MAQKRRKAKRKPARTGAKRKAAKREATERAPARRKAAKRPAAKGRAPGRGASPAAARPTVPELGPWIGGAFPRPGGPGLVELAGRGARVRVQLSDAGDLAQALAHARAAWPGWARVPGTARGRLLLDLGDRLVARADELETQAARFAGLTAAAARTDLRLALERLRWFAGCGDKLPALLGGVDALHGSLVGATLPAPVGVVVVVPPARPPLLGLVACLAPLLVAGNAVVVLVPPALLPAASTLAQTLATCELGGGVANLLCLEPAALVPQLAASRACDALLLAGGDPRERLLLREAAAEHGVRVHEAQAGFDEPATTLLAAFTEPRAYRHPSDLA